MTGAIYHFTDKSEKRPIVYQKQIKELEEFAEKIGVYVEKVYCDFSLKVKDRTQFDAFLEESHLYSALITKDFYHLSKNTMACMKLMKELSEKGITIYTLKDGTFVFTDAPYDKPLRVAKYTCGNEGIKGVNNSIHIQQDVYDLFVKRKTDWTMVNQYADICQIQNDVGQKNLLRLIENKDQFDILLVNNLNDVHWRTSRFFMIREQIGKGIYSLQEGYIDYRKGC